MAEVRQREERREQAPRRRSHPRPEREPESTAPAQQEPEEPEQEASEESAQEASEEPEQEPAKNSGLLGKFGLAAVGWGAVFLVLALYFVWLAAEMGKAAQTGVAPLAGVFAASAVGILCAGAALALARRDRGK